MDDTVTDRFALPLLQPGQAQKEMFHNEAIAALDAIAQPAAVAMGLDTPPSAPAPGQCWIVGDAPSGSWAGQAGRLANWTAGGWRFVAPVEGMTVWIAADAMAARFQSGGWRLGDVAGARLTIGGDQVVGQRRAAIADPSGGAAVDAEARLAVAAILAALRDHGLIAS